MAQVERRSLHLFDSTFLMENSHVLSHIAADRCVNGPTARWLRVGDKQLAVRQADPPIDHAARHRHGEIHSLGQSRLDAGRSAVDRENERARIQSIHVVSHLDSALQGRVQKV